MLARMSGAVTVLGTQDLTNLLGDSLEGVPRLEKGFFGLECDLSIRGRRPSSFDDSAGEDPRPSPRPRRRRRSCGRPSV